MWDLLRSEIEPLSLHWQLESLSLSRQGSPKLFFFFFFLKMIYLFIWLCWVLVEVHEIFSAHAGSLWSTDSLVVAYALWLWLSWSTVCGILFPWPGIEPTSPVLQVIFLTTELPGKSQWWNFNKEFLKRFFLKNHTHGQRRSDLWLPEAGVRGGKLDKGHQRHTLPDKR